MKIYVAAVVLTAAALLWYADYSAVAGNHWDVFATLLALALVTEGAALSMSAGTLSTSVVFVPYLAGILLLGPPSAMLVAGITEFAAETVIRRKPAMKVFHNTAKDVVAVGVAAYLYEFGGGAPGFTEFSLNPFAFLAATVTYFIIANGATATAVSLSTQADISETWGNIVGKGFLENVLSASLSVLLAFLYIELQLVGLLLVVVPLFFVRNTYHQNLRLELANRELLELMVKSIEARDPYTSGHSVRVAGYAKTLARALGLSGKEIEQIETAALLHDVGKIYEEFAPLLRKEGKLTSPERSLMQTHPIRSSDLVATITTLRGYVQLCVRAHHENVDGTGYPDGLAGSEIPIGARIIMVADTADAMMTDRPYREALTYAEVVTELERCAGTQFDPAVVQAFKGSESIRRFAEDKRVRRSPRVAGDLPIPVSARN